MIPQEILEHIQQAEKEYPVCMTPSQNSKEMDIDINLPERDAYIKGRMDERANSFTEEDMFHVYRTWAGSTIDKVRFDKWLQEYKQQKQQWLIKK